ncbi:MAG: aminoacyl-tRNA hydrolase [Deltaproteobacteria bacterium]
MLVVGLGNPGTRYSRTPHNVGFRVLDRLAPPTTHWTERFEGELLVTQVDAQPLVLLKPLTFMNDSGKSVRKAMSFFEISVQSTLVVHDELDLPLGAVKLKRGGGEAGHHGLQSVSAEVGSRDYLRLRVGVGKPAAGKVSDFLLQPLEPAAEQQLEGALSLAREAVALVAREGVERAMNQVNRQADAGSSNPGGCTRGSQSGGGESGRSD